MISKNIKAVTVIGFLNLSSYARNRSSGFLTRSDTYPSVQSLHRQKCGFHMAHLMDTRDDLVVL